MIMRRRYCTFQYVLVLLGIRKRCYQSTPSPLGFTRIKSLAVLFCVLLSLTGTCTAQTQCADSSGCFPPVGNLATGRSINVSSTCAVGSEYCIFFSLGPDCSSCLPESSNSPASINDNNNGTAWYSGIGSNSETTQMQIDFEAPVMFQGMTMVWQSVRPRSMLLERSQDFGITWQVYRFYSSSCENSFMLSDTFVTDTSIFNTTSPICTSTQSQLFPFQDGLVTFSTSQHLSSDSIDAINYRTLTNLRVQLLDRFVEIELSEQRFQYYSVSEWLVWGSCLCNGHAATCTPANGETIATDKVYTGCICEHNTEGGNCEMCRVGFNNAQWMPGTQTDANQCQECMCNGHANDCEYNTTLSSPACLNCTDNTTGNNCELCLPGFYQDQALLLNDPAICTSCSCSSLGIVDDGLCNNNGQCNCKVNVDQDTLDCSQCRDGYWNISESNPEGCQVCDCNMDGTILAPNGLPSCDKETGECLCRQGATGDQCEGCMPGFYDISAGCLPCQCNQGGSLSQICDQSSNNAQCPCIPNVELTTCHRPAAEYYSKTLDDIIFEAEAASSTEDTLVITPLPGSMSIFTGIGFVSLQSFSNVQFTFTAPQSTQYELIMRYEVPVPGISATFTLISLSPVTFDLNCDTTSSMNVSRFNLVSSLPQSERFYVIDSVCLSRNASYQLTIEDTSFAFTRWMIDSLLLLPDFSVTSAYYASQSAQDQRTIIEPCLPRQASMRQTLLPECEEPTFTLSTEFHGTVFACDCDPVGSNSSICYRYSGRCTCLSGVTGRQCDTCIAGTFNLTSSGCQPCGCDPNGSTNPVCDPDDGGACMCQPGIGGRTCNQCLEGFYNFSASGCSPCQCSEYALMDTCDSSGQCICPHGVTGLRCDQCQTNFYNISIDGCSPCNCDLTGSLSSACDPVTGQCSCVGGSVGMSCGVCPNGFFTTDGDVRDRCVRCRCMGRTDECVADNESYGLGMILSNFSTLCSLNPSECDDGWLIRTADGEPAAPYGPSDSNGLGYILLINHMPMLYAPEKFLGDRQATYGLSFSVVLRISNTGALNVNTTIIRIIGSDFEQALIGVFPYPMVTPNGFGAERYLEYTILFIEDSWHVGSATGPTPTFDQFVRVLSNLTELSFSAQYTEDIIEFVHIVNISLQTLLPAESFMNDTDDFTMSYIVPILYPFPTELCQCPEAYSGNSCEACNPGFTRSSGLPTDSCVRCDCNNQTTDCDQLTGVCFNCQGSTEGDQCERCISGYYGDPSVGVECLPCRCPLLDNSFSSTCILNETDGLSTCDNCSQGYTGRNCEQCMNGYYGNPLVGRCTTCECNGNVDPALGPVCDTENGRCLNCLNNTAGFECELCLPGYYGGPQIGKPCMICQCDPRGTVGDCDSLFGTCICQPGVTGQFCDECIDGYWGISQGCIPCDCCTEGTVGGSDVCNKETGACSCKPTVGSSLDDKCCNCTPGYFNFTDTGCQACNCSALAVSIECDQTTGACVCQDGAQGLKCDGCSYGYIGQVPNCERCHECFFQWDNDINYLRRRISDLQLQISNLLEANFNNTSVDLIQMEFDLLIAELQQANDSFNSITLQESSVEQLHQMIINMNSSINGYYEQIADIENELAEARIKLNQAIAFDGTVNMTTINDLLLELLMLNSTIAGEYSTANRTLTLLRREQQTIKDTWTELNSLNASAQDILENLTIANGNTAEAEMLLQEFNEKYDLLRRNLSSLAVHFDMLRRRFYAINETATNASLSLDSAESSFNDLVREVNMTTGEANVALLTAMQLNTTINTTEIAVEMTLARVNDLLNSTMYSVAIANSTLDRINDSLAMAEVVKSNLTQVKAIVRQILNLSIGYSIGEAERLAREINETILPAEVVEEITRNATVVKQAANQTLTAAMEASDSVLVLELMLRQFQDNVNSTNMTQQQVTACHITLQGTIDDTRKQIEQVGGNVTKVENQLQQAEEIFVNATDNIQRSNELGMNNTVRVMDIQAQAMDAEDQALQSQNGIRQAVEDYNAIATRISAAQDQANSTHATAEELQSRAEDLNAKANQVSLQDLKDLLYRYNNETAMVASLQERVRGLQERLEYLTQSFERASQRLQNCYKTP